MSQTSLRAFLALVLTTFALNAQNAPIIGYHVVSATGFSAVANPSSTPLVSNPIVIQAAGAPWLKLWFAGVDLGAASVLRVTGAQDDVIQVLDAAALAAWSDTSAYFNGDTVIVELVVAPGDVASAFISGYDVGYANVTGVDTICGTTDNRVPSTEVRVGRLLNSNMNALCSGGLVSSNSCYMTAGHCVSSGTVFTVEFNCPPSTAGGSIVHPGPQDQYPVIYSTLAFQNGGIGNDWCIARLANNTTTGLPAALLQGFYRLATTLPALNSVTRITGFGSASGVLNLANKTHTGPLVTAGGTNGTTVRYQVDTTGGNSGSSVIDDATVRAFGIHTHGGCTSTGGQNSGTAITHPGPQGHYPTICTPAAPAYAVAVTQSGPGSDIVLAVTDAPADAEIFNVISLLAATPTDTGTFFGLDGGPGAGDLVSFFFTPLGTVPFHVLADGNGDYTLAIPTAPGGVPFSFDIVSVAFGIGPDFANYLGRSPAITVTVWL
jgi:hypothetical protein